MQRDVELDTGRQPPEIEAEAGRSERLASLLTLSYEPMFSWRLDGAIDFWNAGAERLYGYSGEEAVGRISHQLLQTEFPLPFSELRTRLRSERRWSGELRHVCKDGRSVMVDCRMQLLGDETVLEANRDTTDLAKYQAVFRQSGILAGVMELDGRLRDANDLALEACGYSREQVLDRPFCDTPWWRGSEAVKARIRFATSEAAAGRVFREELRYWLADGSERIVDFAMHPIRDRAGKVVFLHPTGIDITERKRIETELHDREQRLRWLASIVDTSADAIVSKTLDGTIRSWNKAAERIFGYSAAEAIGQPITIAIPPDRHDEERDIIARIGRGERIDHFETVRQRKDGSLIDVSITISPVQDATGRIAGASKIARDITEQKRIQEQIETLAREAEHRSKNLLANVQATVNLSHADTPEKLKRAIEGRVRALANVLSLFVETRWIGADLATIAAQELAPYAESSGSRVQIDGPRIMLEPTAAQAAALTLHELTTNAAKYGALSVGEGHVALAWTLTADRHLALRWKETGGPPAQPPARRGFGTRVIEHTIAQLKGTTRFDWDTGGLAFELTLPT